MEKRTAKVEDLISQKEKIIKDLQNELTKEEIYTDYIKEKEIQDNINSINFEIESYMQEWDELQQKLNDLDI